MCAGVVPQQPPTMLTSRSRELAQNAPPCTRASRRTARARWAAPAFGWAETRVGDARELRARRAAAAARPSAQFSPTEAAARAPPSSRRLRSSGRRGSALSVRDRPRDHDRHANPMLANTLDGEERGLRVQRVEDRLDEQEVGAAGDHRPRRSVYAATSSSKVTLRNPGSFDFGRDGRRPVGRADAPATEAAPSPSPRTRRRPRGPFARRQVDFVREPSSVVGLRDAVELKCSISMMSAPASR